MNSSRTLKFLTLSVFLGLLLLATNGLAQTGQEELVPQTPSTPRKQVPPDTSGAKAAPKLAIYANTTAANARHLVPDGGYLSDFIDNTNTQAWFSIPIYFEHDYSIEAYVPFAENGSGVTSLDIGVFEADGTTDITPSTDEFGKQPNLDEQGFEGGDRKTLNNFGSDRFVRIVVRACCGNTPPAAGISIHLRVTDLTQTAARWTTNGYQMLIALNNSSRQTANGFVDYFKEDGTFIAFDTFAIPADGSVQFSHAANVAIGGVLFGGVRVIPTRGAPGVITAHEYNFNAAVGNYLTFPFNARPWVTTTPLQ